MVKRRKIARIALTRTAIVEVWLFRRDAGSWRPHRKRSSAAERLEKTVRLSLRTKLVLAIGAPLLAAYAGMLWCEYNLGRREALGNMESHLAELAARWAAEVDGDLSTAAELARTLGLVVASQPDLSADWLKTLLRENLQNNPNAFGVCIALERRARAGEAHGFAPYYCRDQGDGLRYLDIAAKFPDYSERAWYRPAKLQNRPFWTEPYFDEGVGERFMCTYSVPILRHNEFCGVLTVDLLSDDLLKEITRLKIGSGYCALVSKKGTFISHPDKSLVMRESVFSLAKHSGVEEWADAGSQMVAGRAGLRRIRDYDSGQPEWIVFAPVESAGWSLAAIIPENEVMAPIHARLVRSLGILLVGLIVIVGIVLLVSVRVTKPVAKLALAAESLAQGNLDARVSGVAGDDEIARLARRFNAMVADLKCNIEGRIREESARKEVEGELRAAREIQASLLPAMLPPEREKGFSLYAINAPARLVAGDFFDFFFVDERRLALVMADVSGKGVPAAMYMAVARTKLRDFAKPDKTPAQIVGDLNRCLAEENDRGMFLSAFYGHYNVQTGELVYANAGHNPPYVLRSAGHWETLEPTGPLVAVFPDAIFKNACCRLEPNDLLLAFTDGVTEANAAGGELFGEGRLERLLPAIASDSTASFCEAIIDTVTDFSLGDLKDDVTVLALRRVCLDGVPQVDPPGALCATLPVQPVPDSACKPVTAEAPC
jgi:phosphoserine phosphatase RsbU/P